MQMTDVLIVVVMVILSLTMYVRDLLMQSMAIEVVIGSDFLVYPTQTWPVVVMVLLHEHNLHLAENHLATDQCRLAQLLTLE